MAGSKARKSRTGTEIRHGRTAGIGLAIIPRMRRLALLLVLLSTACLGRSPVRLRPGSNVALPVSPTRSLVEDIVSTVMCQKTRSSADHPEIVGNCVLDARNPLYPSGFVPEMLPIPIIRWP